jgi:MoaA/NifB/PqqE/SkfB family radical SAM enzyme
MYKSSMEVFIHKSRTNAFPRLPLVGNLDLTYRCNHACLHCWVRLPERDPKKSTELSFEEICSIVEQSRRLGTREWNISGGEPMLRDDFTGIFDYLTSKAVNYTLNSNATCITPEIAQLLKRKGTKIMALYGATPATYDRVTGHPGGFEAAMRGFRYLQEAGAGFIVQLIPMRENWNEWEQMQDLARSLSPHQRVGASWLYLSADGTEARNSQIERQRLSPRQVVELDAPQPSHDERMAELQIQGTTRISGCGAVEPGDDRLFARCIAERRDFHIDAYGQMSWCYYIKDPALRYDLRQGSFRDAWEVFIPSCADRVRGGEEWRANCGSCEKRVDCRWCAVYAYLETGRYSAPVPYLCAVADEARAFKSEWQNRHRRYFRVAGITVRIESDLDFDEVTFKQEFAPFAVAGPGEDNVTLRHYFELPSLRDQALGQEVYRKPPWAISRMRSGAWLYLGITSGSSDTDLHRVAVFSADHSHGTIYSPPRELDYIRLHGWNSLSLFPTDQIWLAPLLADRQAVLIHAGAAIVNGQGLVFVGHSSAGKSTTMELLKGARGQTFEATPLRVEVLCDDRNVLRKWPTGADAVGWQVHGTWSHGTTADVSGASAPLKAILFLEQSSHNELLEITDRKLIWRRLLTTLIRAVANAEWWHKELDVLQQIVDEVPCYSMRFDKTGGIVAQLAKLAGERP